jgi:superfamily II DNA/RNA helicase
VYGGTDIRRDQRRLRDGVDIVVATPGRLADLVQRRDIILADVDLVVIDEADRMADMGFLPEVIRLLDRTSDDRQTLLFSATLGRRRRRARPPLPARSRPPRGGVPEAERGDVRHVFFQAERPDRRRLTGDIVRERGPAIVFTRTKHGADRLAKQLAQDGIRTAAIHGNRSQGQRERALAAFHQGQVTTLVATDVAARGIHVDGVAVVVHHDLPATDKDYVHRSGRTGRAGNPGWWSRWSVTSSAPTRKRSSASSACPTGCTRGTCGCSTPPTARAGTPARDPAAGVANADRSSGRSGGLARLTVLARHALRLLRRRGGAAEVRGQPPVVARAGSAAGGSAAAAPRAGHRSRP